MELRRFRQMRASLWKYCRHIQLWGDDRADPEHVRVILYHIRPEKPLGSPWGRWSQELAGGASGLLCLAYYHHSLDQGKCQKRLARWTDSQNNWPAEFYLNFTRWCKSGVSVNVKMPYLFGVIVPARVLIKSQKTAIKINNQLLKLKKQLPWEHLIKAPPHHKQW